jgi:RhtB (resistance to homoserine/threonine) family protein
VDAALVLGSIVAVHVLAIVSPGPNLLIVARTALSGPRGSGIAVSLGIAAGAAVWSSSVLLGLNVVFTHFAWLYGVLKLLGGIYLAYIGIRLWITAKRPLLDTGAHRAAAYDAWSAFGLGLITNLTNPKAAIFYGSVFAAFLAPEAPPWIKAAAVGVIAVNSACWHVVLACLFSAVRAQRVYDRAKVWIDRAAGGALTLLGLGLVLRSHE